jgi:hypothetical protein
MLQCTWNERETLGKCKLVNLLGEKGSVTCAHITHVHFKYEQQ